MIAIEARELENKWETIKNKISLDQNIVQTVQGIINTVKGKGDTALQDYTEKFDGIRLKQFMVSKTVIKKAWQNLKPDLKKALTLAKTRIEKYHQNQERTSWWQEEKGLICGQMIRPLSRVGIYAPGGKAVYPSSLLMAAVPAKVAGCEEIVVCTPPDKKNKRPSDIVLAAAYIAEVDKVFALGGAQAIAAMAYGTKQIPAVDIICGPGNQYVAEAKRQVQGQVKIESVAGPSEVVIIADASARPDWIAADLLAQAEHSEDATAIFITTEKQLIGRVCSEIEKQKEQSSRKDILAVSLKERCFLVTSSSLTQALDLANKIAPEHLELHLNNPWSILPQIKNAGAIFLGPWSVESLGDYILGPNHILPTSGTARFYSPLTLDDFYKKSSIIYVQPDLDKKWLKATIDLAKAEGLDAHARAVGYRKKLKD